MDVLCRTPRTTSTEDLRRPGVTQRRRGLSIWHSKFTRSPRRTKPEGPTECYAAGTDTQVQACEGTIPLAQVDREPRRKGTAQVQAGHLCRIGRGNGTSICSPYCTQPQRCPAYTDGEVEGSPRTATEDGPTLRTGTKMAPPKGRVRLYGRQQGPCRYGQRRCYNGARYRPSYGGRGRDHRQIRKGW